MCKICPENLNSCGTKQSECLSFCIAELVLGFCLSFCIAELVLGSMKFIYFNPRLAMLK